MRRASLALLATLAVAAAASPAHAIVGPGDVAPNFTKTDLDGPVRSLSDYLGKVVFLFEMGYN
jgi:hypothetical protein